MQLYMHLATLGRFKRVAASIQAFARSVTPRSAAPVGWLAQARRAERAGRDSCVGVYTAPNSVTPRLALARCLQHAKPRYVYYDSSRETVWPPTYWPQHKGAQGVDCTSAAGHTCQVAAWAWPRGCWPCAVMQAVVGCQGRPAHLPLCARRRCGNRQELLRLGASSILCLPTDKCILAASLQVCLGGETNGWRASRRRPGPAKS